MNVVMQTKIDDLFASIDMSRSPGCVLGVMKDGHLVYAKGYGLANLEHQLPITPSTTFYIASMAKQFTGFAVALLAAQGKLDLDADIRTYIPDIPDFGHSITAKHLLYHTSGIRSDIFLLLLAGWRIEDVITQQDVIDLVKHQRELDFVPGEEFSYCGTGYSLLAEIVAAVSAMSFPDFCSKHVFMPLGMTNTRFEPDPLAIVPGRASAYLAISEGNYKNAVLTISILGGTGVYTTIEDLALWDENFYTGRVGGSDVIQRMQTQGVLNSGETLSYAFGLVADEFRGRKAFSHGGDGSGIHCYMMRIPSEHLSIAILGNASKLRAATLTQHVADILLEHDPATDASPTGAPAHPTIIKRSRNSLEPLAGRYFDEKSAAIVEVLLKDDKLWLYGYELSATSESRFFFTQHPEATAVFDHTDSNDLTVTIDLGNGPFVCKQVHVVEMADSDLAAYVGAYHSPELDVIWRVALHEEQLIVHRRRHGSSALKPICQDVFADPWVGEILHGNAEWVIAFDRIEGHVVGLRVTAAGGRGRNLRFERMG